MIVIEMRDAAYNKLFDLVDEVKELDKKKRVVMCELEEAVYDCYEASKSDEEYEDDEEHFEDYEKEYKEEFENYDPETEMNLRRSRNSRNSNQMRNMRMREHDEYGIDKNSGGQLSRFRTSMRRRSRIR